MRLTTKMILDTACHAVGAPDDGWICRSSRMRPPLMCTCKRRASRRRCRMARRFRCGVCACDDATFTTCTASGSPGPQINAVAGEMLNIHVQNTLNVPVSVMIPGQAGTTDGAPTMMGIGAQSCPLVYGRDTGTGGGDHLHVGLTQGRNLPVSERNLPIDRSADGPVRRADRCRRYCRVDSLRPCR